ncbi:hypothetical protein BaRGS_00032998 [Batillaria attramentaria]|uniref:Uncharacterized protein n=1 Tax=Batillaria attramentaria TaxID=370345 RepID=A0ABD0JL80_9CAEN
MLADGLHPYVPNDSKAKLELEITDPFFHTDIFQHGVFSIALFKSANASDYQPFLRVIEEWSDKKLCSVWLSDSLPADLNLPMDTKTPDCKLVQMFVLCEDEPSILLSVYQTDAGPQAREKEIMEFTAKTARQLTFFLHRYCYCDFLILPCTISQSSFTVEGIAKEVKEQQDFSRSYYFGPKQLTTDDYEKLRKAATVLSSTSYVPCFLSMTEDSEHFESVSETQKEDWLLLLDSEWRKLLSLLVETISRGKDSLYLTYTKRSKDKLTAAAIEAARRLSFQNEVEIVTNDSTILSCVQKLVDQTKGEFKGSVRLKLKLRDVQLTSKPPVASAHHLEPSTESAATPSEKVCCKCGDLLSRITLSAAAFVSLEHEAEEIIQKKSNTTQGETPKEKFRKSVSTLLNTPGGGVVILHAQDVRSFHAFNIAIRDTVTKLIPDDSGYSDNFECSVSGAHFIFLVKPRSRRLGVSTLKSYIKSSEDAGFFTPTQTEMVARVKKLSEESRASSPSNLAASVELIKEEEVFIDGTPFYESASKQAKDVERKALTEGKEFPQLKYWDGLKVRDCISGMSGVDTGGHLFLGVHQNPGKVGRRTNTKTYLGFGFIRMEEKKRTEIGRDLWDKICKTMLWVGLSSPEPVKLIFRRPKNAGEDERVVEVQVPYYHGVCFYNKQGPKAYRFLPNSPIAKRLTPVEWVIGNGGPRHVQIQNENLITKEIEVEDIDHNEGT